MIPNTLNLTMISNAIFNTAWLTAILLTSACSSNIPPEIKNPLPGGPDVDQVRKQPDVYQSQKVRWGGIILETENKHNASWIKIVALPLDEDGEPLDSDQSPGRFIAIVDEFLEPQLYNSDRKITITGHVVRFETLKVGEFAYNYPVIQVESYYLWPAKQEPSYRDFPPYWWGDPYYPWPYPYYPYPRRY